ncbi:hypothetical protein [Rhodococcus sp. X156]|uniref:hypothetical protein n=1 Tax=Rhodococcus sp. X156 TaxID=2499145 RepID=UPI000FDBDC7F|nr:hypothetical protein [Rhodococcus sp. X156]
MPSPLDELPIHQAPLTMDRVASSDRNFYDRSYLNAHNQDGGIFLVTGFGVYPNLGVTDAFLTVRRDDCQHVVRFSDALTERSLDLAVGGYRIEVLEPLKMLRLVCEHETLSADITWTGAFPAVDEEPHLMLSGARPTLDAQRFAQLGTWSGTLSIAGEDVAVTPDVWSGTRDRSWGIRPVGEGEPAGRAAAEPAEGFWWLYVPLRFDDFAVVVIIQERPDGYRTLNDAKRIWPDGRVEQLGWPRLDITYRSGTRHPERARLHLTAGDGSPVTIDVETVNHVALHVGAGYGGDPDWTHGQWKGAGWVQAQAYDLTDPEVVARVPWGVIDHVARATCDGAVGWGMLEHASIGRHDPSGFVDYSSVAD